MNNMFTAMLAAATAKVEVPVDGSTGVWLKQGATVISSGMKMTGATVSSGYLQNIYARGVASSCFVSEGGSQQVRSGGRSVDNMQYSGVVIVHGGGIISRVTKYGGALTIGDGASGKNIVVSGGGFTISSGGYAEDIILRISATNIPVVYGQASNLTYSNTPGARMEIREGGVVSAFTQIDGNVWCQSRGVIQTGTISGGYLYVFNSASANNLTINSGGNVSVYTGAELSGAFVQSAARLYVPNGGTVHSPVVSSGGSLTVYSGGTALAVTSNAGAVIVVSDGGHIEYA